MVVYRREPGSPGATGRVELLTTLANQSRVAIDNARLFKSWQTRAASSRRRAATSPTFSPT